MSTKTLLTVAEAAAHYKVAKVTIRRWITAGQLEVERPGGPGSRTLRVVLRETLGDTAPEED
jgi:excisionase family DNA binding protein